MKCKFSEYLQRDTFEGNEILTSTRTGRSVSLTGMQQEKRLLEEEEQDQELIGEMLEKKILIPENEDEHRLLQYEAGREIFGNDMLEFTMIPTDACNFRCIYCYEEHRNHYMQDSTYESILKYLRKNISRYKILSLDWFGGEPLLASKKILAFMEQVVQLCRANRVILISNMTTNGYLLSMELMDQLTDKMVLYYQITLDGLAQTHNKQRPLKNGEETYWKIIENLRSIRDKAKSKRMRILIRTNMTREVLENIDEYFAFLSKEFSADKRFLFEFVEVRDWGGERVKALKESMISIKSIDAVNEKAQQYNLEKPSVYHNYAKGIVCAASRENGFIIDYDGTLKKCTIAMESEDEYLKNINSVGYISKDGKLVVDADKQSIWVNPSSPDSETCNGCILYPKCFGTGCRINRLMGTDTGCKWRENMCFY